MKRIYVIIIILISVIFISCGEKEKLNPDYKIPENINCYYGDTLADIKLPKGFSFELPLTTNVGNAGINEFEITYTPDNTEEYNIIKDIKIKVTVHKIDPTSPKLEEIIANYGQTLKDINLPEGFNFNDPLDTFVGGAGVNEFLVNYTPSDLVNYNIIENIPLKINVLKIDPVIPTLDLIYIECGKSLRDINLPNGFSFNDPLDTKLEKNGNFEFSATFTPSDTNNYNVINDVIIKVYVSKALPKYEEIDVINTIYGSTLNDIKLPNRFSFNDSLSTPVGNVGINEFYVTYTPEDTDKYETVTNIKVYINVEKAVPEYLKELSVDGYYNQRLIDISLPKGYQFKDLFLTLNSIGEKEVEAIFIPEDYHNYHTIEDIVVKINVKKAIIELIPLSIFESEYGKTLNDIDLPEGYSFDDSLETFVGKVGLNTFTATYTPLDVEHYEIIKDIEININVKKANPKYQEVINVTATIGDSLSSIILPAGYKLDYLDDYVFVIYGLQRFYATYTPEDTDNFNIITDIPVDIMVEKKTYECEKIINVNSVVGQTLYAISLPNGYEFVEDTSQVLDKVGEFEFNGIYVPDNQNEYDIVEGIIIKVTVKKDTYIVNKAVYVNMPYGYPLERVPLPEGYSFIDSLDNLVGNVGENVFEGIYTPEDLDKYDIVTGVKIYITVVKKNITLNYTDILFVEVGKKLGDIQLPEGFVFVEPETVITDVAQRSYQIKYVDNENYNSDYIFVQVQSYQKSENKLPMIYKEYGTCINDIILPEGYSFIKSTFNSSIINIGLHEYPVIDKDGNLLYVDIFISKINKIPEQKYKFYYNEGETLNCVQLPSGYEFIDDLNTTAGSEGVKTLKGIYRYYSSVYNDLNVDIEVEVVKPKYGLNYDVVHRVHYGQKLKDVLLYLPDGFTINSDLEQTLTEYENRFTCSYKGYDDLELIVLVNKKPNNANSFGQITGTYGDKLSDIELPEGLSFKDDLDTILNAGSYHLEAIYENPDKSYFNDYDLVIYVYIDRATITVPEIGLIEIEYGNYFSNIYSVLPDGFSIYQEYNQEDLVGEIGIHDITLSYQPDDLVNYYPVYDILSQYKVVKATPFYNKEIYLYCYYGSKLSDLQLPEGYTFNDSLDTFVGDVGERKFTVTYTPNDTEHYRIVDDIEIIVYVNHLAITPEIPTGLTLYVGQNFSDLMLPEGWSINETDDVCNYEGDYNINVVYIDENPNYSPYFAVLTVKAIKRPHEFESLDGMQIEYGKSIYDLNLPTGYSISSINTFTIFNKIGNTTVYLNYHSEIYENKKDIPIIVDVTKATPNYQTVTKAVIGEKVKAITLPDNYQILTDPNTIFDKVGEYIIKINYTPKDTEHYKVLENVDYIITVVNVGEFYRPVQLKCEDGKLVWNEHVGVSYYNVRLKDPHSSLAYVFKTTETSYISNYHKFYASVQAVYGGYEDKYSNTVVYEIENTYKVDLIQNITNTGKKNNDSSYSFEVKLDDNKTVEMIITGNGYINEDGNIFLSAGSTLYNVNPMWGMYSAVINNNNSLLYDNLLFSQGYDFNFKDRINSFDEITKSVKNHNFLAFSNEYPTYLKIEAVNDIIITSFEVEGIKDFYPEILDVSLNSDFTSYASGHRYIEEKEVFSSVENIYDFYLIIKPNVIDVLIESDFGIYGIDNFTTGALRDELGNEIPKDSPVFEGYTIDVELFGEIYRVEIPIAKFNYTFDSYYEVNQHLSLPSDGIFNNIVVPVVWPEHLEKATAQNIQILNKLFGNIIDENGTKDIYSLQDQSMYTVSEYFKLASYNKLEVNTFITDWYYTDLSWDIMQSKTPEEDFMNEIVDWIKEKYPNLNWRQFDKNQDGYIDNISIISMAERDNAYKPSSFEGGVSLTFNKPERGAGTPNNPNFKQCILLPFDDLYSEKGYDNSTNIHEISHLFGVLDYYYSNTLGGYDMQDGSLGDWNVFSKYATNWLNPTVVTSDLFDGKGELTFTLRSSALYEEALVIPAYGNEHLGPFSEYIMIDLFTPQGAHLYDSSKVGLQNSQGVRVYHVNSGVVLGDRSIYDLDSHITVGDYYFTSVDKGNSTFQIEIISKDGENKFTKENSYDKFDSNDLFYASDKFDLSTYTEYFYKGLMDNSDTFGYIIEVTSIELDANNDYIATIKISVK